MRYACTDATLDALIASTTPVVLLGGRSRRFASDKLLHPIAAAEVLVDRPIHALRAVFGPRVAGVGSCDARVAARLDAMILDPRPGMGPIAGILAAIEHAPGPVLVLAGDLIDVTAHCVRTIMASAHAAPEANAVIARTDRDHPTLGLYRKSMRDPMRQAIERRRFALHELLSTRPVVRADIDAGCARNINCPEDLSLA